MYYVLYSIKIIRVLYLYYVFAYPASISRHVRLDRPALIIQQIDPTARDLGQSSKALPFFGIAVPAICGASAHSHVQTLLEGRGVGAFYLGVESNLNSYYVVIRS